MEFRLGGGGGSETCFATRTKQGGRRVFVSMHGDTFEVLSATSTAKNITPGKSHLGEHRHQHVEQRYSQPKLTIR